MSLPNSGSSSSIVMSAAGPSKQSHPAGPTVGDRQSVTKRLQSELKALLMSNTPGVSAFPDGENLLKWVATVEGSSGSPYEGQKYKLSISFPSDYPYTAPEVKFETACFHPNVSQMGDICLDILKEEWSAIYNVRTILLSIQCLLGEPNNASPLNSYAASLWNNAEEFKKIVLKKYKEATSSQ